MKKRVLIVDDSRFICEEMKFMLHESEFDVANYVINGEEAVKEYAVLKPDVVTLDIVLPGIDGFECAKLILEGDPNAKLVMVSSLAYDDTVDAANSIGAKGFLFKPFTKEKLICALEEATK